MNRILIIDTELRFYCDLHRTFVDHITMFYTLYCYKVIVVYAYAYSVCHDKERYLYLITDSHQKWVWSVAKMVVDKNK